MKAGGDGTDNHRLIDQICEHPFLQCHQCSIIIHTLRRAMSFVMLQGNPAQWMKRCENISMDGRKSKVTLFGWVVPFPKRELVFSENAHTVGNEHYCLFVDGW